MLRLVHQQQSLSWSGAAAPRQKSARVGALLELSCWRSTGSQITIVLRPVCLCAFVGRCGIFHVIPFWQVAMKRMPNLEYHYGARASVHYINTGMPGCSNFAHWLSLDQLTAIYIVLFNICKQFSDIYAYIHSYEGYCSSQQAWFVLLGCFFFKCKKKQTARSLKAWKQQRWGTGPTATWKQLWTPFRSSLRENTYFYAIWIDCSIYIYAHFTVL